MSEEMAYEEISSINKEKIKKRFKFKEEAIKNLTKTKDWEQGNFDVEDIDEIIYRIESDYKIDGKLEEVFAVIIRKKIYDEVGWIGEFSSPVSTISAVDSASFYSDLYYYYCK